MNIKIPEVVSVYRVNKATNSLIPQMTQITADLVITEESGTTLLSDLTKIKLALSNSVTTMVLVTDLVANTDVTTPPYIVGSNTLSVYIDGIFCTIGSQHQYLEVGTANTISTSIKFNDTIPTGTTITFKTPVLQVGA